MGRRVTAVGCVCVWLNLFHTVTNQTRRPTDCLSAASDWFKTCFFFSVKQPLCKATEFTSKLLAHHLPFCLPSLAHECMSTTRCFSSRFCHCVWALLYSTCAYFTGHWSRAWGVHSAVGRYVLSPVLHAQFTTITIAIILPCSTFDLIPALNIDLYTYLLTNI